MSHKYLKPKKKSIKPIILVLVLCCLLVCCLLLCCGKGMRKYIPSSDVAVVEETQIAESSETAVAVFVPWDTDGAKLPEAYTMEEYEKLSPEQQKVFQEYLGTAGYEEWLKNFVITSENLPWKQADAKQPEDYSWAEYQALTEIEQQAFMAKLGPYGLEEWLQKVLPQNEGTPVSSSGTANSSNTATAKDPKNYTLAEYQALSDAEKKAFVDQLGIRGFQAWLTKVQGQKVNQGQKETYPWEKDGATQPENYTLKEYEALTAAHQKAFREHLGTNGFAAWQKKVQEAKYPWEKAGAKKPKDYTWEEYKALTADQKKAFQEYLGARGFETWRETFFKQEEYPWEKADAKQPADYTWAEYKKLTESQQYAFQAFLNSAGMETWLQKVTDIPWNETDAKQPEAYSLEEYKKLTEKQQLAFQIRLGAIGFDAWNEEANREKEVYPWEKSGAKQPKDYTLAEYEALTASQQLAFQNQLGSETFEAWLNKVQSKQEPNPWEKSGAKQPKDYTLAEYNALTASQQMDFQNQLGSEAFSAWLNKNQSKPAANPWETSGAKQPKDYTMEEYNALTASQQMAFQNQLGSEAFESWLNRNQSKPAANPWETSGAKQPKDYTMEEFNALTAAQQMAFQNQLGAEGFESWLNKDQSQPEEANPWDTPGEKQPEEYTLEEFNALTAAQQMAFVNHLGSDAFDAWLNKDQSQPEENPWDDSDEKQPADYTWEEFEALTGAQQMAFQNYLGADGFDAWLNQVQGQPEASSLDEPEENPPEEDTALETDTLPES